MIMVHGHTVLPHAGSTHGGCGWLVGSLAIWQILDCGCHWVHVCVCGGGGVCMSGCPITKC